MKIKELAIQCFLDMDSVALSKLINNDGIYLNFSKLQFLKYLSACFQEFSNSGDTSLCKETDVCKHVNDGDSYLFIGNISRKYIKMLIFENNEKNLNIQECYCFTDDASEIEMNSRIFVDPNKGNPF